MVKISFQPAVAGIKGNKADKASASVAAPAPATEILLTPARLARDNFFRCGVLYEDALSSQARTQMELEEDVKIYLDENYERINVPVPQFGGGDPADIIHDFQRAKRRAGKGSAYPVFWNLGCPAPEGPGPREGMGLTAYHDISLDKCYVIELNTTIVLPPRNFWELLMNVKGSTSVGPRTATPSATSRTPLWWRHSSVGWCEALCPSPAAVFLFFFPAALSSFPLLSLYFGRVSIEVTCLSVSPQPFPPPCTRAVTSRGPPSLLAPHPGCGGGRGDTTKRFLCPTVLKPGLPRPGPRVTLGAPGEG
uniref:Integral membrane protein 2 n=1 Tax=Callithrix jacchus TaxID=9483 RepID=A0A8I3VZX7_CALJA